MNFDKVNRQRPTQSLTYTPRLLIQQNLQPCIRVYHVSYKWTLQQLQTHTAHSDRVWLNVETFAALLYVQLENADGWMNDWNSE